MKEFLTPRFHGRPSWMIDTASLSTDGKQILSVRTDGQLVVWDTNGTRLHESTLKHFPLGSSDRLVAFGEGQLLRRSDKPDRRIIVGTPAIRSDARAARRVGERASRT